MRVRTEREMASVCEREAAETEQPQHPTAHGPAHQHAAHLQVPHAARAVVGHREKVRLRAHSPVGHVVEVLVVLPHVRPEGGGWGVNLDGLYNAGDRR